MTGNNPNRGAHMFIYVYTQLLVEGIGGGAGERGIGFYTENDMLQTKTGNNTYYSYAWTRNGNAGNKEAPRSNCVVSSKQTIRLESKINGDALSMVNDGITIVPPSGEVSSTVCEGMSCLSYTLSPLTSWSTPCSGASRGNLTPSSNISLASQQPVLGHHYGQKQQDRQV